MASIVRQYAFEIVSIGICLLAFSVFVWAITWRAFWLDYKLFVPTNLRQNAPPVLIVLHGRSGSSSDMQQWLGFDELAEKHGLLVIYPQSKHTGWDFGVGVRERGHVGRQYIDHSRYITDIMVRVDRDHPFNWKRVYIVGVSDGASMAMRFSCSSNTEIAGLISVAATIAVYSITDCVNTQPIPVMLMHGTDDTVMPWNGKIYKEYPVFLSFEKSIEWWYDRNGCNGQDNGKWQFQQFVGAIDAVDITNCVKGSSISAYRIDGGGHTWPGRDHPRNRTTGHVNRDSDGSRMVIDWIISTIQVAY